MIMFNIIWGFTIWQLISFTPTLILLLFIFYLCLWRNILGSKLQELIGFYKRNNGFGYASNAADWHAGIRKISGKKKYSIDIRILPTLKCHPEVTSDQTIPDHSLSGLIRLKRTQITVCARICQCSDLARWKQSLIRPKSEIVQIFVRTWPRPNLDHCPEGSALETTSD